jgi:fibronectin-binding autotransporter adhesin
MRFAGLRITVLGTIASVAVVFAGTADAGTLYYWYGDDTTLGGTGAWDTTTTSTAWSASTDSYSATYWPNATGCDAYFGGGGGAVTVGGTVTCGNLAIAAADYSFATGGTLSLGGGITTSYDSGSSAVGSAIALLASQAWTVGAGGELAVSGVVSGSGMALTADGGGTLTLGATNTYTGGTTINAGATLNLTGAVSATGSIVDNGTLAFNGASAYACSNAISGAGSLYKRGANRLTISGNNTSFTGNVYLSSGTLVASGAATTNKPLGTGLLTLSGGTLSSGNANTRLYNPIYVTPSTNTTVYSGSYDLRLDYVDTTTTVTGSGTMTFLINSSSRVIRLYPDTRQSTGTFALTGSAGVLELATYSGGASTTWILNGANAIRISFGAPLTVPMGELSGANASAAIYAANSYKLTLEVGALNTNAAFAGHLYDTTGGVSGTSKQLAINKVGTATWSLTGSNAYSGGSTVTSGGLAVNGSLASAVNVIGGVLSGSGSIAGNVTVGDATLAPGSSPATLTIAGVLGLSSGSTLSYELCGTNTAPGGGVNDLIQSVTDLTLDGTLNVTETVADSFLSANAGDKWTLITYGGNLANNGLDLSAMPTLGGGRYFAVDTGTTGQVNLVVMVPEPGTLALLASSLIGLIAYAWRKRK